VRPADLAAELRRRGDHVELGELGALFALAELRIESLRIEHAYNAQLGALAPRWAALVMPTRMRAPHEARQDHQPQRRHERERDRPP
jgi:hypothetical protein